MKNLMNTENVARVRDVLLGMERACWEQGEAMQAFWEMGDYKNLVILARQAVERQLPDGRPAVINTFDFSTGTDPCVCGAGLYYAYELTGDSCFKDAYDKLLVWALEKAPRNDEGIVYHLIDSKQFWADSMYMLPPLLTLAGRYDEAMKQYNGYWKALYNPELKLLHTIIDDGTKEWVRELHRGVGNGFAIVGAASMIDLMPPEQEVYRKELAGKAKLIIDSMLRYMHEGCVFYDALDDDTSFLAMNGALFPAIAIYRGLAAGWLDKSYEEIAGRLRHAMHGCLDSYGFVRNVCHSPKFRSTGTSPDAQAFFLMMESAYADYRNL